MTVAEYLDLWLQEYAEVSMRPRTLQGYRSVVESRLKPAFGTLQLADLSPRHVQSH